MNIHCILHETFEGLGCIKKWIEKKGYQLTYTHTFKSEPFPADHEFDWLIIMGGSLSIYEEEKFPGVVPEKKFILEAIRSGKTVLGICLGAQFIASALGSKIYPGKAKEIGWFPVRMNMPNLPVELNTIPKEFTAFHWHGDTFDIPEKCVHLASSEVTPNQAFIYNNNVLALQFHYEMDDEAIGLMIKYSGVDKMKGPFIQQKEEILKGKKYIKANNNTMFTMLDYLDTNTSFR